MIPLYWPVPSDFNITQPYGCTGEIEEPPLGGCAHFHRAIDLGNGQCGAPIRAAAAGVVHFSGFISVRQSNGTYVQQSLITLNHGGGIATGYIHEATRLVGVGAHVTDLQLIAAVGSVGAGACHLHYFVKSGVNFAADVLSDSNGTWLDPTEVTLQMYADSARLPLAAPNPRPFTVAAGTTVYFYDVASPGKALGTIPAGTYHADEQRTITWYQTTTPPIPRGGPFLHVVDGPGAGHLVVQGLVALAPATPPPPPPTKLGAGVYEFQP